MALSGKTVSLKNIIAKVYRDFGLKEEDDYVNFFEWGVEALEQIGTFEQLVTKVTDGRHDNPNPIEIHNYKGELPPDLISINFVDYKGNSMLPSTSSFSLDHIDTGGNIADTGLSVNIAKVQNSVYEGPFSRVTLNYTYKIENGYIKTAFEHGKLIISYQAVPVCCDGFPLVPDDVSFREAVYRYIVYKYLYPKFVMGRVPAQVYADAEQKWYHYCMQAGAKAKMPNLGQLENIKRNYLKLKPDVSRFSKFFELNGYE